MSASITTTNETATPTENVVYLIGELRGISRQTETKTGALMVRRVISVARHWTDADGRFHEDYDEFELSSWGQVLPTPYSTTYLLFIKISRKHHHEQLHCELRGSIQPRFVSCLHRLL